MVRVEVVAQSEQGPPLDCYQCPDDTCKRKAIVVFEPSGGLSEKEATFVEREIARRGAFFPSDTTGGRQTRRNW